MVKINGKDYELFGKVRGGNGNKFNRIAKLAVMFDELEVKLTNFITRGMRGNYFVTEHARCALALRLMMQTGIRIGNEDSAEGYTTKPHPNSKAVPMFVQTYGLTTLKSEHFTFSENECDISFLGKKHVQNNFKISGELCDLLKKYFVQFPRKTLELNVFGITAYDLTKFIKRSVGDQFTPKDFRTLRANMEAWNKLQAISNEPKAKTKTLFNAEVKAIAVHVSECLNNTHGVCKKSYIDPELFKYHLQTRWI